eukprot:13478435-Alexandrium_andersonii.AAC.1
MAQSSPRGRALACPRWPKPPLPKRLPIVLLDGSAGPRLDQQVLLRLFQRAFPPPDNNSDDFVRFCREPRPAGAS